MTAPAISRERDASWPLALGLVVALLLHAAVVLILGGGLGRSAWHHDPAQPPRDDAALPTPPEEIRPGSDTSKTASIAWIANDDYQKLMARHAKTEQAALQQNVDTIEQAPPTLDATPPAPTAPPTPQTTPTPPVPEQLAQRPPSPAPRPDSPLPVTRAQGPNFANPRPTVPSPEQRQQPRPDAPPTKPAAPAPPQESNPTSAKKSPARTSPTSLKPTPIKVRNGKVIAGPGYEVNPVQPDIPLGIRFTSIPSQNMRVRLRFNTRGEVMKATIVRSSGDGPLDDVILSSLYKWTATGERLKAIGHDFDQEFTLLLFDDEE